MQLDTGPNEIQGLHELKLACRMCLDAMEEGDLIGFHVHLLDTGEETGDEMTASITLITKGGKVIALAHIPGYPDRIDRIEDGESWAGARTTIFGPDCPEVSLEKVQFIVGGDVELQTLENGDQLFYHEDGRLLKLPANTRASTIADRPVVGNAVVLRGNARWTTAGT